MKKILLLIGLILNILTAFAQASVEAKINPIEMMIGEQATVTLTVQAGEGANVQWPTFQPRQQIVPGVEVLATHTSSQTMTLTLTSFDGNLYHLPPFKVKVNDKEVKSADLALKVVEIEVDTTHMEKFFGPKDVQDNPFQWSDWSLSFWLSVLILVLLAVGYWFYLRLRDNKPIIAHIKIVRRLLPHQKAMKEIEQIKADKMVTSENQKEYYTKLTDTLRKYIEEAYPPTWRPHSRTGRTAEHRVEQCHQDVAPRQPDSRLPQDTERQDDPHGRELRLRPLRSSSGR